MKKINQASFFLKAFVGVGLLYALIFLSFVPRMGLDDRHLSSIVSGVFMRQTPYEFMLFTHVWIGHFLKNLYLLYDGVAWYDLYLLVSSFIAHLVICYVLLRKHQTDFSKAGKILFLGVFLFAGSIVLYSIIRFYFTIVGAYVGLAGVLLFCEECFSKSPHRFRLGIAVGLMVWSSSIRFHSFLLALVLTFPLITYWLVTKWQIIRTNPREKLGFGSIGILAIGILFVTNSLAYDLNPEWENYREYIKYPVSILDYDHLPSGPYAAVYQENQWSRNDHAMLQSWFFTDEQTFGLKRFKDLMGDHSIYTVKFIRQRGVWFVLGQLQKAFTSTHAQLAGIGWLVLLFLASSPKSFLILSSLMGGTVVILLLYLAYFMKINEYHITYLFFSIPILVLSYGASLKITNTSRFGLILLLTFGLWSVHTNIPRSTVNQIDIDGFHQLTESLEEDKLYVWWDIAPNYVAAGFLDSPRRIKGIDLIHLGHCSYPPLVKETLAKYQIPNFHQGMINHKDVILVSRDYKNVFYQRYMKEHYNRDITFELIEEKHQFKFYKVLEKP